MRRTVIARPPKVFCKDSWRLGLEWAAIRRTETWKAKMPKLRERNAEDTPPAEARMDWVETSGDNSEVAKVNSSLC